MLHTSCTCQTHWQMFSLFSLSLLLHNFLFKWFAFSLKKDHLHVIPKGMAWYLYSNERMMKKDIDNQLTKTQCSNKKQVVFSRYKGYTKQLILINRHQRAIDWLTCESLMLYPQQPLKAPGGSWKYCGEFRLPLPLKAPSSSWEHCAMVKPP